MSSRAFSSLIRKHLWRTRNLYCMYRRKYSTTYTPTAPLGSLAAVEEFCCSTMKPVGKANSVLGVLIDIDGVLVRGRQVIPSAKEAIETLLESDVPFLFLTNSGCETEYHKAKFLSSILDLPISEEQVVLSHSPIRLLTSLHSKNVVVSGQGPVTDIAKSCGFKNVYSVEELIDAFPYLNTNDRRRAFQAESSKDSNIPQIEAVILMGEPISWEAHMQIILDILVSNGRPNTALPYQSRGKHIPVIAVNTDFLWMGEAPNPRFGNGAFLLCLESLYEKLTGERLHYTGILGKPSLLTYEYSTMKLLSLGKNSYSEDQGDKCIYAVGDNLDTDVYGANLFHALISGKDEFSEDCDYRSMLASKSLSAPFPSTLKAMHSILVRTGVSKVEKNMAAPENLNHLHRDMPFIPALRKPNHVTTNILEAVKLVCNMKHAKMSRSFAAS